MSNKQYALILAFVFLLILPGIFWGLPSAITPQDDAPLPLGSLLFFTEYTKSQLNTVYPAFHQILMLPLYAVAFAIYWLMGGFSRVNSVWPYGLRDVSVFFSMLIVLTNLVAAVMAVLLLRFTFPMVERRRWLWFGVLLIVTNGVFVYYARVGNLDMPYIFWWTVAWLGLWRYLIQGKPSFISLVPAGIAAAFAIGSKDQASGLVIGAGLLLLLIGPLPSTPFRARFRQAIVFTTTVVLTYVLVAILPQPMRWWNHARFVVSPHAPTKIPFTPAGEVQLFVVMLGRLRSVFTIPVLLLCVLGVYTLFRSGRKRAFWVLALPIIGYYIVIIAKARVAQPRFLLPFMIPILVFATEGAGFVGERLSRWPGGRQAWIGALTLLLAFNFAFSYGPVTYAQTFDMKRQVARDLPALLPLGSPLLISRMQSYEFPNATIYERYRLMRMPNEPIIPASRHSASIFKPLDAQVKYYLLGSGTAGLPSNLPVPSAPLRGDLVREWQYPEWVRQDVLVPCILEYRLSSPTGPIPLDYVPPPFVVSGTAQ